MNDEKEVVEVELLAECGQIAQRLRILERTWSFSICSNEFCTLSDSQDDVDPKFMKYLRDLEDTVIKIHCLQELLGQAGGPERINNKKVHMKINMNYSAAATKNNNIDLTTSPTGVHELKDDHSHSSTTIDVGINRENDNKSLLNNVDAGTQRDPNPDDCSSNRKQQNVYRQQHQLCAKITNDDLKTLLRELKRKVDFTEKMNWLCKLSLQ